MRERTEGRVGFFEFFDGALQLLHLAFTGVVVGPQGADLVAEVVDGVRHITRRVRESHVLPLAWGDKGICVRVEAVRVFSVGMEGVGHRQPPRRPGSMDP